jgi:hypothetical protein
MADIVSVKRELFEKLKSDNGVLGAGIKGTGKAEYIVIFVKEFSSQVANLIPSTFKGIKVKAELQKVAKPMS